MRKLSSQAALVAALFLLDGKPAPAQGSGSGPKINGTGSGAGEKINGVRDTLPQGGAAPGATTKRATYKPAPAGYSVANVTSWAQAHQAKAPGYKYVYIPPEQVSNAEMVNVLRVAAGKAWNHLSWKTEIDVPVDISDGAGLAFGLNAQVVWGGDAETNWGYLANCSAKASIDVSPAPPGACETFSATEPVPIPRFVYNATNGGPYANVHQTPGNHDAFQSKFNPGGLKYLSTHKEAIVCGPRITAYRPVTINGVETLYSFSSDEFDGRDNGDITYTNAPTESDQRGTGALNAGPGDGNTAIASEWWIQLPNGFMYWGIHGEGSQERGKAEFPFAIDPANWRQDNTLATGRSCITCHNAGIQSAKSDEQFAGKNGWTSNEELSTMYKVVRDKFQASLRKLVEGLSDGNDDLQSRLIFGTIEPISKAIMLVEGPYTGGNDCSFFCNGKYGPQRQNLCETLPTK